MQTAPNLVTKFYWGFLLLHYIQIDHWNILCIIAIVKWWWWLLGKSTNDLHIIHCISTANHLSSSVHDEAALFNVISSINLKICHSKFKRYLNSCQYTVQAFLSLVSCPKVLVQFYDNFFFCYSNSKLLNECINYARLVCHCHAFNIHVIYACDRKMKLVFGNRFDTKKKSFQLFRNISVLHTHLILHFTILWLSFTDWIEEWKEKHTKQKEKEKSVLWRCKLLDHLLLVMYVQRSYNKL